MTKVSASEKADAAFYAALQMLGGNGYSAEYPLE
jgi:alkylation response protein AidB-like acyl-CoA dehydrogenase